MENGARVNVSAGRGGEFNIYHANDGLYYNVRELRGLKARLKCRHYNKGCRGTAVINLEDLALEHRHEHNHQPDPYLLEELKLRQEIMIQASTNVTGRTGRQIINDCKLGCRNPEVASRFTPSRMRGRVYEARSRNYPPIPVTLLYLGVLLGLPNMRAICTTVDGTDYIFEGIIGNEMGKTISIIFISGRMVQFLQSRMQIHCDGTFKKRPHKPRCRQIFNIVTKFRDTVVAVMRVLMMSKSEQSYLSLFNYIKNLAPNFSPTIIHSDFERALMNAWKRVFPQAAIIGCLWHYCVAVSRYARSLGISDLAKENPLVLSFIRCLCAVPMLPRQKIVPAVDSLWQEVDASGWGHELLSLFQYWEREWLPRIDELSVYGVPDRTNNCSEADNHSLSTVIPQNHPNIWFLLSAFVKLEYLAWTDKIAIENGRQVSGGRKWSALHNDRIVRRNCEMLASNDITTLQFLHNISWSVAGAVNHGLLIDNEDSDGESGSESE